MLSLPFWCFCSNPCYIATDRWFNRFWWHWFLFLLLSQFSFYHNFNVVIQAWGSFATVGGVVMKGCLPCCIFRMNNHGHLVALTMVACMFYAQTRFMHLLIKGQSCNAQVRAMLTQCLRYSKWFLPGSSSWKAKRSKNNNNTCILSWKLGNKDFMSEKGWRGQMKRYNARGMGNRN